MKKPTTFKIGEREYTLAFSVRALANMERSIGRSILSIITGTQANWMSNMTIDFTASGLKYGLQTEERFDPYDIIDDAFEHGMELNELTGYVLLAIEQNRGIKIERSQLELDDALKEVGEYNPSIDLGHGVIVKFKITIIDEEAPKE